MVNFEKDPERIKAAADSGVITKEDYQIWQGAQGYKDLLRKSLDTDTLSVKQYATESNKAEGLHWQRDFTAGTLRFKLHGIFEPMDITKNNLVMKSIQLAPLQKTKPLVNSNTTVEQLVQNINEFTAMCDKLQQQINRR